MPALIPELIAMASDPTVKTADLLLKALVCTESNQFKSDPLRDWIEAEKDIAALLNGEN